MSEEKKVRRQYTAEQRVALPSVVLSRTRIGIRLPKEHRLARTAKPDPGVLPGSAERRLCTEGRNHVGRRGIGLARPVAQRDHDQPDVR
jgi:hypothetical protein